MVSQRVEDRPLKTVGCTECNFKTVKKSDLYRHLLHTHGLKDDMAAKFLDHALQKNEAKNKEHFREITSGLMTLKRPLTRGSDRPPTLRYDTQGQRVYSIGQVERISSNGDAFGTIITTHPRHSGVIFIPKKDAENMHLKKGALITFTTHITNRANLLAGNVALLLPYKSPEDMEFPKLRGRERDRRSETPTSPKRSSSEHQRFMPPPTLTPPRRARSVISECEEENLSSSTSFRSC
jgi:hypothetical protein